MQTRDVAAPDPLPERATLEQQVRSLRERLAFYEGFDLLIQDNVAHARELFRRAAQERETAAADSERHRLRAGRHSDYLHGELQAIATDLNEVARAVDQLSRRVARALGDAPSTNGQGTARDDSAEQSIAVVVHGIESARAALSLQRFVASLPQVSAVSAREFAGGVLRLEARSDQSLRIDQFSSWADARPIHPLTERRDVIEFALHDAEGDRVLG